MKLESEKISNKYYKINGHGDYDHEMFDHPTDKDLPVAITLLEIYWHFHRKHKKLFYKMEKIVKPL